MVEYRKIATIKATQWFKMGDHPAVVPWEQFPATYGWVDTLEGGHVVSPGDWIATGVQGEHWPIKPDVFAETYVPADTRPPADEALRIAVEALEHIAALEDAAGDASRFGFMGFRKAKSRARAALKTLTEWSKP